MLYLFILAPLSETKIILFKVWLSLRLPGNPWINTLIKLINEINKLINEIYKQRLRTTILFEVFFF